MQLPNPLCEFCRHEDGTFNYEEWHAILIGIGDGLQPWRPDEPSCKTEHHYYIVARGVTTFLATCILIRVIGGLQWPTT
jgi:hypothetical protein